MMDDLNVLRVKLQFMLTSLPSSEKAAAVWLMDNLQHVGDMQLNTICHKSNLNGASIIRLCKRMGYRGYLDFRDDVRQAVSLMRSQSADGALMEQPSMQKLMATVIEKNIETMRNTLALINDQYDKVLTALQQANVIVMYGNGDAIIPCELIKIKLMKIGKTCIVYSDQDLQMFSASTIHPGDVVLAVSHTGRSKSVVEATRIACERGATTIGVTCFSKSPLLRYCKYVLYGGTGNGLDSDDIISRRIAEQTILETLYSSMVNSSTQEIAIDKRLGTEAIHKMMKIREDADAN
jgi:DNA-binding MurR/RpiR family transcriptional regulator